MSDNESSHASQLPADHRQKFESQGVVGTTCNLDALVQLLGMEIVTALATSLISCLCTPERANTLVVVRAKHMISPTQGLENLEELKEKLVAQKADVSKRLQIEEIEQGKSRASVVAKWLKDTEHFFDETKAIERKIERGKRCIPNCWSRSNLGKCISKLIGKATALLETGSKLLVGYLSFHGSNVGMELPTTELVGAERTLEKVWECFVDDKSRMVGVYGMGGVGKTTIMKAAHNKLVKQEHLFDKVIWLTVSKDANVHKLQNVIAEDINHDLSHVQDPNKRSASLCRALQRRGRIAYIFDDVWETFHLLEVGIPDFTEENNCKLVLTSRSLDVCRRMNCKKNIKVEPLLEEEAWKLFIETVGLELVPEVEHIAKDVVKECAGLPLAIITVGGAMRGKEEPEWRVALIELQRKESTKWNLDMEGKVFECLKFSYNHLQDDILKKCFLYCALYPEDYEINPEELIDHWVMEGLIKDSSMRGELCWGHTILNTLKRCSMLEYGLADRGPWEYVRLHDLIRDMALYITKKNPHFMVKAGGKLKKLRDEKEWGGNLEKASFMESDLNEILISPNCPEVVTLLLNRIPLQNIADEFFVKMHGLRVLNLSNTEIELLPDSFSNLVNIHVLDVSWCKLLKRVPSVERLQSLWVLRLAETAIEELPHGMEALLNLKRLDLTRTRLREIPTFFISKFSLLQELLMYPLHYPSGFVDELLSLTQLENISISFNDLSDLTSFVGLEDFKRLKSFFFNVRHDLDMSEFHQTRRRSVTVRSDSHDVPGSVLRIPQNTKYLGIMEFNELTRLSELTCLKDVQKLKKCYIRECSKMEYILFSEEDYLLKHLEDITVKGCYNLTTLYKGVPTPDSLQRLKKLHISKCQNLKYLLSFKLFKELQSLLEIYIDCSELEELIIATEEEMDGWDNSGFTSGLKKLKLVKLPKLKTLFSMRMLQYFQNLEEVDVLYCSGLEELVSEEVRSRDAIHKSFKLPRLKKLDLVNLPKLESIWSGEIVCDVLQSIRVSSCPRLKRLQQFTGGQLPQSALREIRGSSEWWDSLEWDGPFAKNLLQPLFRVHW